MKIQLNTKALERLIGGDSDIEVELRNSVVQEFAKRHLKPIVNSSAFIDVMADFKKTITTEIKSMLPIEWKRDNHWSSNLLYNWKGSLDAQEFKVVLYAEVKSLTEDMFKEILREKVEEFKLWAISEFEKKAYTLVGRLDFETLVRKITREEIANIQFGVMLPEK